MGVLDAIKYQTRCFTRWQDKRGFQIAERMELDLVGQELHDPESATLTPRAHSSFWTLVLDSLSVFHENEADIDIGLDCRAVPF